MNYIKAELKQRFKMRDLGPVVDLATGCRQLAQLTRLDLMKIAKPLVASTVQVPSIVIRVDIQLNVQFATILQH